MTTSTTVILDKFKAETVTIQTSFNVEINGHDCMVTGQYNIDSNCFYPSSINGQYYSEWAEAHKIDEYALHDELQDLYEKRG